MPYANTEAMQQFLDRFAATIADDEHVVMVLDQAGWHDSRALSVPANVTLVALPPYSPELNPVERVWLYLKERFLSHRLHDDYEAIVDAACKAWSRLTARPVASIALLIPLDPQGQDLGSMVLYAASLTMMRRCGATISTLDD